MAIGMWMPFVMDLQSRAASQARSLHLLLAMVQHIDRRWLLITARQLHSQPQLGKEIACGQLAAVRIGAYAGITCCRTEAMSCSDRAMMASASMKLISMSSCVNCTARHPVAGVRQMYGVPSCLTKPCAVAV